MNVIRIGRYLAAPIPELPELSQMIGKNVVIMVRELAENEDVSAITSIDRLQSDEDLSDAFEGFEETLRKWRQEPWMREIE